MNIGWGELWSVCGTVVVVLDRFAARCTRPDVDDFPFVFLHCAACGVCHSDLHVINKDQPYPIPCVLGHEVTGEVVEHGKHTDSATIKRFGSPPFICVTRSCFLLLTIHTVSE